MLVHDPGNSKNILLSGVYGPTQALEKYYFWDQPVRMNSIVDLPWILVGDFNELELISDKQGGTPSSLQKTKRVSSFLSTM